MISILRILYSSYKKTDNIFTSIVGEQIKDDLLNNKNSELNKTNWNVIKLLQLISDLFLVKLPINCPSWIPNPIKKLFFGENSKYLPAKEEYEDGICIIYLNGILSNKELIELNRQELSKIFNRKINVLHNVTDSLISDLIECLIGKTTEDLTEASTVTLYTLSNKLLNPKIKKVIFVCHSQGTIIISNVLKNLHKLGLDKKEYLEKLEIYAFANCSTKMNYIIDELPYMEHFANSNDFVACLGCNCSEKLKDIISIDGKIFIKEKSGHMFNSHYIDNFVEDYPESKLNQYIKKPVMKENASEFKRVIKKFSTESSEDDSEYKVNRYIKKKKKVIKEYSSEDSE